MPLRRIGEWIFLTSALVGGEYLQDRIVKGKAIPVTGREGP
jgi:hypothetical protein